MARYTCKACNQDFEGACDQVMVACPQCGAMQTLPKSQEKRIVDAYNHGNALRQKGEFDAAEVLFRQVLVADPGDAEGYWCRMLCRYGITYVKDATSGEYVPSIARSVDAPVAQDKDFRHAIQKCGSQQKAIYEAEAARIEAVHKVKRYESAVLLERAGGLEATTRARALFESVGDYQDAPAHMAACDEALSTLKVTDAKSRKKKDRKLAIAVAVAVVVALMIPLTTMVIMPGTRYQDAKAKYEAGQYTDSIAEFIELGNFWDSADMVKTVKAARTKASLASATVGSSVYLGSYEQNNDLTDGLESLEWKVLEVSNGRALLVTRYVIDARTFNDSAATGNTFEGSDLQAWLNGDFKETAFDDEDASVIVGEVSVLTRQQIERDFASYTDRVAEGTKYAVAHAVWKNAEGMCRWWIDDPNASNNCGSTVGPSGAIDADRCFVYDTRGGIRPCIWVNIG